LIVEGSAAAESACGWHGDSDQVLSEVSELAIALVADADDLAATLGDFVPSLGTLWHQLTIYGITYRNEGLVALGCAVGVVGVALEAGAIGLLRFGGAGGGRHCLGRLFASTAVPAAGIMTVVTASGAAAPRPPSPRSSLRATSVRARPRPPSTAARRRPRRRT